MRMSILKKAAAALFGNAGVGDVLEDKTFQSITAGAAATGTMPNRGQYDITPGKLPVLIPDGYHDGTGIVDSLGGDAEAKHVLETVSFSSDEAGREVAGTMTNRGGVVITPGTSNKTIPEGYHDGTGYVEGDANLEAGNIKSGVEIFGVTGTMTPDSPPAGNADVDDVLYGKTFESAIAGAGAVGTLKLTGNAAAGDVLANKTFYNTNPKTQVTGSMTNRGAYNITPGASAIAIPKGYHNGMGYVAAIPGFSVQSGTTEMLYNDTIKEVSIDTVDLSKSFLIFNYRDNDTTSSLLVRYVKGVLNSNKITFTRKAKNSACNIAYSVITSDLLRVQRGTTTFTDGSITIPISSVDLTKSFVIVTNREPDGSYDYEANKALLQAYLSSSTVLFLSFSHWDAKGDCAWQVVEFLV